MYISNTLYTEVSCSLTLGLEIKTKLKTPSTEMSHEKIVSTVACSKESDVVKVSPNVKAAVEARDNQVIANESNE